MRWSALWYAEWLGVRQELAGLIELAAFVILGLLVFGLVDAHGVIPPPLLLWLLLLFGGMMYVGRAFDREWAGDGSRVLEGLRQIPGAMFRLFWIKWGKCCLVLAGTGGVAALLLAAFSTAPAVWLPWSLAPLGLGIAGLCALGTLFAAGLLMQDRREYLLPIVCYPLAIPLILGVAQCLASGLAVQRVEPVWLKLTAGCALFYTVGAALLFPHLVEE